MMKTKEIIIVGAGHVGSAASTIAAIKEATRRGIGVQFIPQDDQVRECADGTVLIKDTQDIPTPIELLEKECTRITYNPARDFNLLRPETRAERRKQFRRKNRRKY